MTTSVSPRTAARFWPLILVGALAALLAGVGWGAVAATSDATVVLRGTPGQPFELPADLPDGAAVYVAPREVPPNEVGCRVGELVRRGSAVPPVSASTITVDGEVLVEAVDLSPQFAGRPVVCEGPGVETLAVAVDDRTQALTLAVALVVGSLFIAGTALVLRVVARAQPD